MTQRNALLPAVIMAVSQLLLMPTGAQAGQVLKILQLNFNNEIVAFDDRDERIRDRRFAAIIEYIQRESPDVILMEEGWNYKKYPSIAIPLAKAIGYDSFYRIGLGFPFLLWDSNVVLAKKEFHMREKRKVQLPHSAWHLGDEINWVIPFGAITNAVGARLTLADGQSLLVYTTHLLGSSANDKLDQVRGFDKEVRQHAVNYDHLGWGEAKVILAGDMNADPLSPSMTYLRDQGYVDTWAAAHPDHFNDNASATNCGDPLSPRFNPFTVAANEFPAQDEWAPDERIDYIYAHGPGIRTLASTQVFTHPENGVWMSDHYGVLTTVAIDDEAAPAPANPLSDSDDLPAFHQPAQALQVDDSVFAPCEKKIDCELDLGALDANAAVGFAVLNHSTDRLSVKLDGPARVLPSASVGLDPKKISSFAFAAPGDYRLVIYDSVGDSAKAVLHVAF